MKAPNETVSLTSSASGLPLYIGPGVIDLVERNVRQMEKVRQENSYLRGILRTLSKLCRKSHNGRGIHKLIDENRELLNFVYKASPDIDDESAFVIETLIYNREKFLHYIASVLKIKLKHKFNRNSYRVDINGRFPRAWSGRFYHDPSTSIHK